MPGMIDVHTHIDSLDRAKRALDSGVTTVRTAGVSGYQDVGIRELVYTGQIPGPEVVAAGTFLTTDLGPALLSDPRFAELHDGVNSDDDFRLVVQVNADRGVDFIKTRGTQRAGLPYTDPRQQVYTERQLRVIVEEAAKFRHSRHGARAWRRRCARRRAGGRQKHRTWHLSEHRDDAAHEGAGHLARADVDYDRRPRRGSQ